MHESQFILGRTEAVRLVQGLFSSVSEPEVTAVESAGTVNYLYRVGTALTAAKSRIAACSARRPARTSPASPPCIGNLAAHHHNALARDLQKLLVSGGGSIDSGATVIVPAPPKDPADAGPPWHRSRRTSPSETLPP